MGALAYALAAAARAEEENGEGGRGGEGKEVWLPEFAQSRPTYLGLFLLPEKCKGKKLEVASACLWGLFEMEGRRWGQKPTRNRV